MFLLIAIGLLGVGGWILLSQNLSSAQNELGEKYSHLEPIPTALNKQNNQTGRISLSAQDEQFLEKAIELKKKKILAQMELDIEEIEAQKLKAKNIEPPSDRQYEFGRPHTQTPTSVAPTPLPTQNETALEKKAPVPPLYPSLLSVNLTQKAAVIRTIKNKVRTVQEGEILENYRVDKIEQKSILLFYNNEKEKKIFLES